MENMAEVGIAPAADHFGSLHAKAIVLEKGDVVFIHRFPKTRPASTGIEFSLGIKQWLAATDALKDALGLRVPVSPRESAFRTLSPRNPKLFRGQ